MSKEFDVHTTTWDSKPERFGDHVLVTTVTTNIYPAEVPWQVLMERAVFDPFRGVGHRPTMYLGLFDQLYTKAPVANDTAEQQDAARVEVCLNMVAQLRELGIVVTGIPEGVMK